MSPTTCDPVWRVIGQSVRGASHERSGLPNQDAIRWLPETSEGPPLILVLSDGHGSAKSFRSDVGSRVAVEQTAQLLREFVSVQPDAVNLSTLKRTAEERIPQEAVRRWRDAVDQHLLDSPFTEDEVSRLADRRGPSSQRALVANPRLAYGATLLAVVVTDDYLLFLQLGDGDLLTVMESGEVVRPFEHDARLFANETTSLCMERAWREVRLRFQARYGRLPALVMAATDGYANSFVNEAAFLKVGSDLLDILRHDGPDAVEENLLDWLQEASAAGSGDDITLGILFRTDLLPSREVAASDVAALEQVTETDEPDLGAQDPALAGTPARGSQSEEHLRSRIVARIKQDGPREPIKTARLADLIGDDAEDDPLSPGGGDDPPEGRDETTVGDHGMA